MKTKTIFIIIGVLFVILLGFLPKFLHDITPMNNKSCNLSGYIVSEISAGCDVNLISYSDSYTLSNNGVLVKTGSAWIRGDDFDNLENIKSLNVQYFLNNFFDKRFLDKSTLLYDEFGGKKAGFVVAMLRKMGYDNVYLFIDNHLVRNKQISKEVLGQSFIGSEVISGAIDFGKYKIVIDPFELNVSTGSLFLYISDYATMSKDSFYLGFKDKVYIKNIYWSMMLDQGKIKTKDQIEELLKQSNIDVSKYDNVYIYNPGEFWAGGLVYLILQSHFG